MNRTHAMDFSREKNSASHENRKLTNNSEICLTVVLRVGTRVSEEDAILGHSLSHDDGECADVVPKTDVLP